MLHFIILRSYHMLIYERSVMPEIWDELLLLLQEVPDDLLPVVDILGQHLLCNTPLIIHRAVMLNVYPGSRIRIFPSRIRIKEFKYFNPKKLFLSSRKYDPCCSSRIQILIFYPSRIPESKRHRIRNTAIEKGTWRDSSTFRLQEKHVSIV